MKVIIDLIEDIREEIGNQPDFTLHAMLLKEDPKDSARLINAGESALKRFHLDDVSRKLMFTIDASDQSIDIATLIQHILILGMDKMMYEVKLEVNHQHQDVEVIGFGKSMAERKYFFFIKL